MIELVNLRARPDLLAEIAQYHHQEWQYLNPGYALEDRISAMAAYLDDGSVPSMWLALESGELRGTAAVIACDMDTRSDLSPWLASVFVLPRYRRQGTGSTLATKVACEVQAAGYPEIFLFTPDQAQLYARLGWREFSREDYRGTRVSVMVKALVNTAEL